MFFESNFLSFIFIIVWSRDENASIEFDNIAMFFFLIRFNEMSYLRSIENEISDENRFFVMIRFEMKWWSTQTFERTTKKTKSIKKTIQKSIAKSSSILKCSISSKKKKKLRWNEQIVQFRVSIHIECFVDFICNELDQNIQNDFQLNKQISRFELLKFFHQTM